ncbi:hypothetical protein HELRODRAFT_162659 [Helobdella robusta]|uniref:Uncharacterized protein n=1 Tax=Helobdella robusta TaxID=6412 RepID=T1ESZ3_HELRO|nr:hypothetical protein HELRODRAFT_162659 [Helobdella robusta]ESN99166.1 hypothetical protein HELRODRAFT_162659 [Helobdella robusta]
MESDCRTNQTLNMQAKDAENAQISAVECVASDNHHHHHNIIECDLTDDHYHKIVECGPTDYHDNNTGESRLTENHHRHKIVECGFTDDQQHNTVECGFTDDQQHNTVECGFTDDQQHNTVECGLSDECHRKQNIDECGTSGDHYHNIRECSQTDDRYRQEAVECALTSNSPADEAQGVATQTRMPTDGSTMPMNDSMMLINNSNMPAVDAEAASEATFTGDEPFINKLKGFIETRENDGKSYVEIINELIDPNNFSLANLPPGDKEIINNLQNQLGGAVQDLKAGICSYLALQRHKECLLQKCKCAMGGKKLKELEQEVFENQPELMEVFEKITKSRRAPKMDKSVADDEADEAEKDKNYEKNKEELNDEDDDEDDEDDDDDEKVESEILEMINQLELLKQHVKVAETWFHNLILLTIQFDQLKLDPKILDMEKSYRWFRLTETTLLHVLSSLFAATDAQNISLLSFLNMSPAYKKITLSLVTAFEVLAVKRKINKLDYIILAIYRPGSEQLTTSFFDELISVLECVTYFVIGRFQHSHRELINHINEPKHILGGTLDLIVASDNIAVNEVKDMSLLLILTTIQFLIDKSICSSHIYLRGTSHLRSLEVILKPAYIYLPPPYNVPAYVCVLMHGQGDLNELSDDLYEFLVDFNKHRPPASFSPSTSASMHPCASAFMHLSIYAPLHPCIPFFGKERNFSILAMFTMFTMFTVFMFFAMFTTSLGKILYQAEEAPDYESMKQNVKVVEQLSNDIKMEFGIAKRATSQFIGRK